MAAGNWLPRKLFSSVLPVRKNSFLAFFNSSGRLFQPRFKFSCPCLLLIHMVMNLMYLLWVIHRLRESCLFSATALSPQGA